MTQAESRESDADILKARAASEQSREVGTEAKIEPSLQRAVGLS